LTKPFLFSAAIHLSVLLILFIVASFDTIDTGYIERVDIRIRNQNMTSRFSGRVLASSPSDTMRSIRKKANIPENQEVIGSQVSDSFSSLLNDNQGSIALPDFQIPASIKPQVDKVVSRDLPTVDPLKGFEKYLPGLEQKSGGSDNPWLITWENGKLRGILSEPVLDPEEFPVETERLQNIIVRIMVSPQGDVLSAEILSPGSGDIRIDRRIHNLALQLILEPWPEEKGMQEGSLHLMFMDENR